jgi:hypothetical protein
MTIYNYLRKELLFFLSCFLSAVFVLSGCQKQPNLQFGTTYTDDNTGANIVVVDTSTVNVYTVYVDSTATAATGFHYVGSYNDQFLGTVSSRSFFQVGVPTALPALDPRFDIYDSIGMVLFFKRANPYYGDTTQSQTYVVNQVIDTLFQLAPFQRGWFSNSYLPLGPTLGSATVLIAPNIPYTSQGTGDTVRIRMDDNLGQTLFNMVYNKSDTVNPQKPQIFLNWFKGLCLSPGPGAPANIIDGFKDSCVMRVYYRANALISSESFIDFPLTNKGAQWNNINVNRTGKPISNLILPTQIAQTPPATLSSAIGNIGYVQTIGGLNVKLTFPNLSSIALRRDFVGLLRATLTVRPVPGSFSQIWRLPPAVGIYVTDLNNLIGPPLPAVGVASTQTGNLVLDYFNPLNTAYTYDVTNFVKVQITNPSPTASQTGLMLSVPAPANTAAFNRLMVADQTYPLTQQISLSVYYISLFPHQ